MTASSSSATLITGASGGIGEALAYEFAKEGGPLVLVARGGEGLARVALQAKERGASRVETVTLDLAKPEAVDDLDSALAALGLQVETLVNNAGYGAVGAFADIAEEVAIGMVDLNIRALTALCRRFLPGMIARRKGGILNLASTASFVPGPHMAIYYASKAYVRSLSEALSYEAKGSEVTVTALCPGPTTTGFQSRARLEGAWIMRAMPVMTAEAVAAIGYRGFRAGKPVVVTGWANRAMVASVRLAPRSVLLAMTRALHD
jgi:short-subunit dehydrogenase